MTETLNRNIESCKTFVTFGAMQGLNFLLIVVNVRASSHLQYAMTAATDFAICLLSWSLFKKTMDAEGWAAKLGYATGGACGSLIAMWLTKTWGS
jgi:hypothetical protein